MEGLHFSLMVLAEVLAAAAVWICLREAALARKIEATFFLSVSIFWFGAMIGVFEPVRVPVRLPEQQYQQRYQKTALPAPADNPVPVGEALSDLELRYGRWTAVYDITAHTVYLPSGKKLEAHSGLGDRQDNPHYVNVRMRGATPPNVYALEPREQLFHGVQALRLIPVGDGPGFGRAGLLAHSYMLGPRGDSNGCVVFKEYKSFLQAFESGEVKRLVVVAHMD